MQIDEDKWDCFVIISQMIVLEFSLENWSYLEYTNTFQKHALPVSVSWTKNKK